MGTKARIGLLKETRIMPEDGRHGTGWLDEA